MTSSPPKSEASLASSLRSSWRVFLDTYEPLRSNLYRYCRHLTHSPWDAEDLAQDTMARAFVTLGQLAPQYGPEAARRTVLYGMLFGSAPGQGRRLRRRASFRTAGAPGASARRGGLPP